jgi:hypothetical protein
LAKRTSSSNGVEAYRFTLWSRAERPGEDGLAAGFWVPWIKSIMGRTPRPYKRYSCSLFRDTDYQKAMPMMLIVASAFITGRLNEQDQKTMVPILPKRTFFEPFFEFGLHVDSTFEFGNSHAYTRTRAVAAAFKFTS